MLLLDNKQCRQWFKLEERIGGIVKEINYLLTTNSIAKKVSG